MTTARTMCPMNCHPTLCGMLVDVENGKLVNVRGDPDNPDSRGFLCIRGQASKEIFDNPNKIKFVPLTAKDRFTALQSGEVDVLARNTTWTSSRDTSLGLNFTGVNYYDGQGFLVRKALKVNSALELNDAAE